MIAGPQRAAESGLGSCRSFVPANPLRPSSAPGAGIGGHLKSCPWARFPMLHFSSGRRKRN
jgi:hypothetical protein